MRVTPLYLWERCVHKNYNAIYYQPFELSTMQNAQIKKGERDGNLILRYKNGDDKAIEILISRYKDKVYTTILLVVKDRYIAEDLLQETFIKVIDTVVSGKYQDKNMFGQWVQRIAFNLAIDSFRKKKRRPTIVTGEGKSLIDNMKFLEDSVEEQHVKSDTRRQVHRYIRKLPEPQRRVLIMRHFMELSFQDIADKLGISINTALGRMRYALINLRKKMKTLSDN